jgi:S1-C subfamily serine protease
LRGTSEASADAPVSLGDIITSVDGEAIDAGDDLTRILERKAVGDTVQLEIWRDGQRQTVTVRLGASR